MAVLTTHSTTLDRLVPEKNQNSSSSKIAQSMSSRQVCLCCSNPLLRHIKLGKLYWRCNHCYQVMPVIEDAQVIEDVAKEMPLFVHPERSFHQQLLISIPPLQKQQCEQEGYERSIPDLTKTRMMFHSS